MNIKPSDLLFAKYSLYAVYRLLEKLDVLSCRYTMTNDGTTANQDDTFIEKFVKADSL